MNSITRFLDEIDQRRGFARAPTQSEIDRLVRNAATRMREYLEYGEIAEAEALAVEIEGFQSAAATIGRNPNYAPLPPPAGWVPWRLTLACWAEGLMHGPRAGRVFWTPANWTEENARAHAASLYAWRYSGFAVERAPEEEAA